MPGAKLSVVHMDSRKWPDRPHWRYDMTYLGDDEHGIWLWAGPETIAQHRDDPPRERGIGFITLIPDGEWWLAMFFSDHPDYGTYVNVGTPCEWLGDTVRQVDLDLDLVRYHDGTCAVLDEDEFKEQKNRLGYPPRLIAGATDGAATALRLLESATEPFGSDATRWLDLAVSKSVT